MFDMFCNRAGFFLSYDDTIVVKLICLYPKLKDEVMGWDNEDVLCILIGST